MRERYEIEQDIKLTIYEKQLELLFDIRELLKEKEKPKSDTTEKFEGLMK